MADGIPNQDLNAGIDTSRGMDYEIKENEAQRGRQSAEHADDFDMKVADPTLSAKNLNKPGERMDIHGDVGGTSD